MNIQLRLKVAGRDRVIDKRQICAYEETTFMNTLQNGDTVDTTTVYLKSGMCHNVDMLFSDFDKIIQEIIE